MIGIGLCNNELGLNLYELLLKYSPPCVLETSITAAECQQMLYCQKTLQNSGCPTYLCNPWLPWDPREATTSRKKLEERLEFLPFYYETFHYKSLLDCELYSTSVGT
jgi:hypothetical protein